ncbi:hypothetical protein LMG6871_02849 [Ralstonia edaphis]|uniref:hypothetical protein n=1 Tax=Ralstonia edaphi TaxID=3058599 RepID=UPI0028F5CE1E|nr:hypothetical protein [Ralstonia sp. LMG 6871]CAJ0719417.1 hypothetical protein LMG6871_02849 [Ralstonia sp. LMG 6871]
MSINPTFTGEMQLAGWSETHNGGCKVTFWLPDAAELDAFRALTVRKGNTAGHRFMAALVEVGDDEQPVPQDPAPEAPKGGALSKLAGMWCQEQDFWTFLGQKHGFTCHSPDGAANAVRCLCMVNSRAELDHDAEAGGRFQVMIRIPYMRWMSGDRS